MTDQALDLNTAIFAKTPLGQQEIQSRSLGLSALVRRTLVLVDGKRSGKELGAFVVGHDIFTILGELLDKGCIDGKSSATPLAVSELVGKPETPLPKTKKSEDADLIGLPAVEMRSAKDLEMARNFMTNSVNNMYGQHTRITLIEAIFKCTTSAELREVYPDWVETMAASAIGARRLPELRQKLFAVL